MATLDYALLAEYARVDPSGLLTAVGGSFDRVRAANPAAGQQVFVAMRLLLDVSETSAEFDVSVRPPSGQFTMGFSGSAMPNAAAEPVDGKIGVVTTMGMVVPLVERGRYLVTVTLRGQEPHELPFIVEHVPPDGG